MPDLGQLRVTLCVQFPAAIWTLFWEASLNSYTHKYKEGSKFQWYLRLVTFFHYLFLCFFHWLHGEYTPAIRIDNSEHIL